MASSPAGIEGNDINEFWGQVGPACSCYPLQGAIGGGGLLCLTNSFVALRFILYSNFKPKVSLGNNIELYHS